MRLMMIGTNFRTAPLELREKLALSNDQVAELSRQLLAQFGDVELVWLATCNRAEAYLARPSHRPPSPQQWLDLLAQITGCEAEALTNSQVTLTNDQAINHLFRVASGLDSMVLGEPQILGQVKRSYEQATSLNTVGPALHRGFQQAMATAKRVRHDTVLGHGQASVGSVAIRFARQIFDQFQDKTIVGVGAGAMGKLVLHHAADLSPRKLVVTNRTAQRSEELAQQIRSRRADSSIGDVAVAPWESLDELIVEADLAVFSTGASEPVVGHAMLRAAMRKRRGRPLLLLDLAVPRDVSPEIADLPDVYLYNIDDLQQTAEAAMQKRSGQVQQVEQMLSEPVQACLWQIQHADLGRVIGQVRKQMHTLAQGEAQRTAAKLSASAGVPVEQVERALGEQAHRLINKILHVPLSQVDHHRADASLAFFSAALRRLFESDASSAVDSDAGADVGSADGFVADADDQAEGRSPVDAEFQAEGRSPVDAEFQAEGKHRVSADSDGGADDAVDRHAITDVNGDAIHGVDADAKRSDCPASMDRQR